MKEYGFGRYEGALSQIDGEWPLTVASGKGVAALRAGVLIVRIFDLRKLGAAI
jgi:hypothetical protein